MLTMKAVSLLLIRTVKLLPHFNLASFLIFLILEAWKGEQMMAMLIQVNVSLINNFYCESGLF